MLAALMSPLAPPEHLSQISDKSSIFGEAAALRPLVRAVVACVLREPADHADVEDCTGETLRRALEAKDKPREVRPWVLGIARHVALDALRARQRARARTAAGGGAAPESSEANLVERLADPSATPFE